MKLRELLSKIQDGEYINVDGMFGMVEKLRDNLSDDFQNCEVCNIYTLDGQIEIEVLERK